MSSGGTGTVGGSDRQVSSEPGRAICRSVMGPPGSWSTARATTARYPALVRSSSVWVPYPVTRSPSRNATRSAWCSINGETVVAMVVRPRR